MQSNHFKNYLFHCIGFEIASFNTHVKGQSFEVYGASVIYLLFGRLFFKHELCGGLLAQIPAEEQRHFVSPLSQFGPAVAPSVFVGENVPISKVIGVPKVIDDEVFLRDPGSALVAVVPAEHGPENFNVLLREEPRPLHPGPVYFVGLRLPDRVLLHDDHFLFFLRRR